MRHGALLTLLLLGLPQVAAADAAVGAAVAVLPAADLAVERPGTPATAASPGLDLRFDPAQLPSAQPRPYGAPAIESDWADPDAELDAADRGLSFGLEIKPHRRIGALARRDETEDPGLGDQLQRLIERPVLGLRGRYRF